MWEEGWVRKTSFCDHYGKDWFGQESPIDTKSGVGCVNEDQDIGMLLKDLPIDVLLISRQEIATVQWPNRRIQ